MNYREVAESLRDLCRDDMVDDYITHTEQCIQAIEDALRAAAHVPLPTLQRPLLPCPCCGTYPKIETVQVGARSTDRARYIRCPDCGLMGPMTYATGAASMAEMYTAWNQRKR